MELKQKKIDGFTINYLEHPSGNLIIKSIIHGMIANFTPTTKGGRERLQKWKRKVALDIKSRRTQRYNPEDSYAVSIGMKFHTPTHGEQKFDLDNYSKPIIDAVAAGLFCNENEDLTKLKRYNQFDDSNFRHVYLERLLDVKQESQEGVIILVSKK